MYQRPHNPNKGFMIGTAILAFGVLVIVVIFTLLALRMSNRTAEEMVRYAGQYYVIGVGGDVIGETVTIYLNDSILFDAPIESDTIQIICHKWEAENALLVVNKATDHVVTTTLNDDGDKVMLHRQGTQIIAVRE